MRARLLKPGYFEDADLSRVPLGAHFLFAGLWCLADREGRLKDIPRRIAGDVFPHRDDIDEPMVNQWLTDLAAKKLIIRYRSGDERYIQVINFKKHQKVNAHEAQSEIPEPLVDQWCTNGSPMVDHCTTNREPLPSASENSPQVSDSRLDSALVNHCTTIDQPLVVQCSGQAEAEAVVEAVVEAKAATSKLTVITSAGEPERRPPPPPKVERKPSPPGNNAPALRRFRPEAIAAVATMLETWTEGLLGKPDRQICEVLLLTIGGDSDEYLESMREWFLAIRRAGKSPHGIQGWGWFPRVLAADLKALEERDKPQGGVA